LFFLLRPPPPTSTLFPYTTLFRSSDLKLIKEMSRVQTYKCGDPDPVLYGSVLDPASDSTNFETTGQRPYLYFTRLHYSACRMTLDRKSTRLNSSHDQISYAVFCLK